MFKNKIYGWLLLVGVFITSVHYMFFINEIRDNNKCFLSLQRAQYDNQNRLTQEFYKVSFDPQLAAGRPEALDKVFQDHFKRLEELDKKFSCGQ